MFSTVYFNLFCLYSIVAKASSNDPCQNFVSINTPLHTFNTPLHTLSKHFIRYQLVKYHGNKIRKFTL